MTYISLPDARAISLEIQKPARDSFSFVAQFLPNLTAIARERIESQHESTEDFMLLCIGGGDRWKGLIDKFELSDEDAEKVNDPNRVVIAAIPIDDFDAYLTFNDQQIRSYCMKTPEQGSVRMLVLSAYGGIRADLNIYGADTRQ